MGSRVTASTVLASSDIIRTKTPGNKRKKWHRFLQEWLLPWHVKDQRLLNCQSRSLLYQPLPSPSLRPRLVTCLPTSPPMSSPSLTDRSSWRQSCSTKVSDPPLTSVCLSPEQDQLLRPSP